MRWSRLCLAASLSLLALAAPAHAAPSLVSLGTFDTPTYAAASASDRSRVFVTEKAGRVRLILDGAVQATPFLDLTSIVRSSDNERGLLSIAFPPDYATSGTFYVYLTAKAPAGEIQVWQYQRSAANANVADAGSGRLLIAIPHTDAANHNGGTVQVGPDGKVWLATGDGGGGDNQFGHSQDPGSRLGKLLRLDPGVAGTPPVEQLAQGLRNPFRFSFAPDGTIVIADVGQSGWEEIDVGLAANYGWPCREGAHAYHSDPGCNGVTTADPVVEKNHGSDGFCAIVGGYVIRDPGLPTLNGRYIYGDNCNQALRSVNLSAPAGDAAVGINVPALAGFGEDACGRLLVVSLAGPVSRIVDGTATPCDVVTPTPTPTPTATATATHGHEHDRGHGQTAERPTADGHRDRHGDSDADRHCHANGHRDGHAQRHGDGHRPADGNGRADGDRRAHRDPGRRAERHPQADRDHPARLPGRRRPPLRGFDAGHRRALPRAPWVPLRRSQDRRGLQRQRQRARVPQGHRAARARQARRREAAPHVQPHALGGGARRRARRRRQRPLAQSERQGHSLTPRIMPSTSTSGCSLPASTPGPTWRPCGCSRPPRSIATSA